MLTINTKDLNNALSLVAKFANPKATLPILQNILFEVKKNTLWLTASNLEMFIKVTLGVKTEDEFKVAIPARIASEVFLSLSESTIILNKLETQLEVSSGNFKGRLLFTDPTDFPEFVIAKKEDLSLPVADFLQIYTKVGFAVSTDESRPVLTGVCFASGENSLEVIGTDGFRLSRVVLPVKLSTSSSLIVPRGILQQLPSFATFGGNLAIGFEKENSQVSFAVGEVVASSRLISGDFPDYNKIIPTNFQVKTSVDVHDLTSAVKNAAVFARDASDVIKMVVVKKSVEITSESNAYGNQSTKLEADSSFENSYSGENLTVAFNYRFLLDYLKTVAGETVKISFVSESSPCVFTDPTDEHYTHLIMPVKI